MLSSSEIEVLMFCCDYCGKVIQKNGGQRFCSEKCRVKFHSEEKESGCWEWKGAITKSGYGVGWAFGRYIRAHQLSYIAFKGDYPRNMLICHTCDNPKCVNPYHLYLGTPKSNMEDKIKRGRKGNCGRKPTYSEDFQRQCFELNQSGHSYGEIEEKLGISQTGAFLLVKKYAKKINQEAKKKNPKPSFTYSKEQVDLAFKLRSEGKTFKEISKQTGIKISSCKYICNNPKTAILRKNKGT